MREYFDEQLGRLKNEMIAMGALCEEAIREAVSALEGGSGASARRAMELDPHIDRMERTVESMCLDLLLRQQPVARDLRLVSAALKMVTDLERIGDQASDIAEIITHRGPAGGIDCSSVSRMAAEASRMVSDSVDAYVKGDVVLAQSVIRHDDVVDALFGEVRDFLVRGIADSSVDGREALDILMVAKYFERIGDHATNIAEWVEFCELGAQEADGELIHDMLR